MDAGADVNGRRGEGQAPMVSTAITPLHEAVKMQNTDMAERLITHSADVNAENAGGQTPLYYAVYRHDPQMIDILIQHGADIHHKDVDGRTAAD
jgi:ankyrin repeat protein